MQKEIINFLKQSEGYLSGEDISRALKISRAAIWKYIHQLRGDGYDILAVPHLGYKLNSCPDKLLPHEVQFNLGTKYMGKNIVYEETVGSTMDAAFRLGMEGEPEGTVVCAESQTKGKGRLGRHWSSPKYKGLYASIILRPQLSPAQVSQLTLLSAVAVCDGVRSATQLPVAIKWPNDLLLHNKKVAGILTEMSAEMDRVRFIVVGIGLNVNTPASQLPSGASSLKQEAHKGFDRVRLFQEILRSMERWYERFQKHGFNDAIQQWKAYSSTIGQRVRVCDQQGDIEGDAVDVDENGSLIIRSDAGIILKRMTGDVVQLR
jgi:BirA family biotin operon repressor/biotin-[acetyl-CoA-carboxylase] ligase